MASNSWIVSDYYTPTQDRMLAGQQEAMRRMMLEQLNRSHLSAITNPFEQPKKNKVLLLCKP